MVETIKIEQFNYAKTEFIQIARTHCEKRICDTAFGANSLVHEIQIRNRLLMVNNQIERNTLLEMNRWRDHLRARYHEIKHWLQGLPYTDENFTLIHKFPPGYYFDPAYLITDDPAHLIVGDSMWLHALWIVPNTDETFDDHDNIPNYVDNPPMASSPPFDLIFFYTGAITGTPTGGHGFKVKATAKSIIELTADASDITFAPTFINLDRAGSATFTAIGMAQAMSRTITITAKTSPYGVEVGQLITIPNW